MRRVCVRVCATLLAGGCQVAFAQSLSERASGTVDATIGPISAGGATSKSYFRRVDRAAFPRDWPLTVDTADIGCILEQPQTSVLIVVSAQAWALNDATREWVRRTSPVIDIGGKTFPVMAGDAHEPWIAKNKDVDGAPMSLAPLIEVARRIGCLARPTR